MYFGRKKMYLITCNIVVTLLIITNCFGQNLDLTEYKSDTTTDENFATETERETTVSVTVKNTKNFPEDCSQREKKPLQHKFNSNARLRKCCPIGEGLSMNEEDQSGAVCVSTSQNFVMGAIDVTLYDNCIEDMESDVILPFEIGNPCNTFNGTAEVSSLRKTSYEINSNCD